MILSPKNKSTKAVELKPCFTPESSFQNSRYPKDIKQITVTGSFEENNYYNSGTNQIFWSFDKKNPIYTFPKTTNRVPYNIKFNLNIENSYSSLSFSFYSKLEEYTHSLQTGCRTDEFTIFFDDPSQSAKNRILHNQKYLLYYNLSTLIMFQQSLCYLFHHMTIS